MSDTPRTDAAILSWAEFTDEGYGPSKYVHVDDMRALERDLIKAKQAISEEKSRNAEREGEYCKINAELHREIQRRGVYAGALTEAAKALTDEFYNGSFTSSDRAFLIGALRDALAKNVIPTGAIEPPIYGGEFSYDHATGTLKPLREASLEIREEPPLYVEHPEDQRCRGCGKTFGDHYGMACYASGDGPWFEAGDCVDQRGEEKKPFPAPGAWFPVTVLGQPMRCLGPGVWEYARWPSDEETLRTGDKS
jgi:hypothetical protein